MTGNLCERLWLDFTVQTTVLRHRAWSFSLLKAAKVGEEFEKSEFGIKKLLKLYGKP